MKKIYSELSRIQQELKAPKNLFNRFGNYNYRNAEGILESVKPLLNGLALIINDEPVAIGNRFYIKATVTLTDGEESVSSVAYAREDEVKKGMDGCQITGACSSYARKYALNALLMIDDSKDSDDDTLSPKNPDNSDQPKNQPKQQPKNEQPKATVNVSSKVPSNNPVKDYLANELTFMKQMFGIADTNEMMAKFGEMRKALIAKGIIENKSSGEQTMQEAQKMIEAIYANFSPEGVANARTA